MTNDQLVDQIMSAVMTKISADRPAAPAARQQVTVPEATQFVGTTALGDTIGLVIPNVDPQLHALMGIDPGFRSIGIIGDRTGAGPQIFAADEGVKATNTEIVSIELARDTKGGASSSSAPRTSRTPAAPSR